MSLERDDVAPGPRGVPVLGNLPWFWFGRRIELHARHLRAHGDVVRYKFGPITAHLVLHPDAVKHVLQENNANYEKGRGTKRLRLLLGDGLLTSEGELWRRQRKLAQPSFHPKRVAALVRTMVDATEAMLAEWKPRAVRGEALDVAGEMMRLTLDIVARTLFGADLKGEAARVYDALTTSLDFANRRLMSPVQIPMALPLPGNLQFKRAKKTLDDVVFAIVDARRRSAREAERGERGEPTHGSDLLAMLMDARDEETGQAMTDQQLRDEIMTIVLAGHETTAAALAWTWMLLSREPVVWRKLRAEVESVLGERSLTADDLPKLKYTRMVIEEGMRLYPPAWMFGRRALKEDVVGGFRIPADSLVLVSPFFTHRHPDLWPNPEGFDPERFGPDEVAKRPKHAYLPFGGGPRICIGNGFAMAEAQAILATVTQRYRVEVLTRDVPLDPKITLRPSGRMQAGLRPLAVHPVVST
jgi:cytochrome P450